MDTDPKTMTNRDPRPATRPPHPRPWRAEQSPRMPSVWRVIDAAGDMVAFGLCELDARSIAANNQQQAADSTQTPTQPKE